MAHNTKVVGYYAVNDKSTAGVILPLAEPDWLVSSHDKDGELGDASMAAVSVCHVQHSPMLLLLSYGSTFYELFSMFLFFG